VNFCDGLVRWVSSRGNAVVDAAAAVARGSNTVNYFGVSHFDSVDPGITRAKPSNQNQCGELSTHFGLY
jgi:hypothetical protein